MIDLPFEVGVLPQRLELRTVQQRLAGEAVIERLHAHTIADQMEPLLLPVPQRDGEHAVEAVDRAVKAPRIERREHHLGVRMAAPLHAQLFAQVAEVVDLAVERPDVSA